MSAEPDQGGERIDGDLDSHRIGPQGQDSLAGPGLSSIPSTLAAVAARVEGLPVSIWSYHGSSAYHIGPMAQDFQDALGLGVEPDQDGVLTISVVDYLGALLATVQSQARRITALEEGTS